MDLIDAKPSDFMFMYAISLTDLNSFKIVLDNMEFAYDGNIPEHVKAKEYLETRLYPAIKEGLKMVEAHNGTQSDS